MNDTEVARPDRTVRRHVVWLVLTSGLTCAVLHNALAALAERRCFDALTVMSCGALRSTSGPAPSLASLRCTLSTCVVYSCHDVNPRIHGARSHAAPCAATQAHPQPTEGTHNSTSSARCATSAPPASQLRHDARRHISGKTAAFTAARRRPAGRARLGSGTTACPARANP